MRGVRARAHWPEYAIEAAGLGLFMLSACAFGVLLGHPASPVSAALPGPLARRALVGLAMGLTAVALIYSPWGRRSGAHFNPATTLTFWRLGKVEAHDALGYAAAQTAGGLAGVGLAAALAGPALAHPEVRYAATAPGPAGAAAAFAAEAAMTFVLMSVVLRVSNSARFARCTGLAAGALVALYITLAAPLSGMSLNPARSLASAVPAGAWDAFWVYLAAPPIGMLAAGAIYARGGARVVHCAKLDHRPASRCIFRCRQAELAAGPRATSRVSQAKVAHPAP
jgi:aquaporin Z